MLNPCLTVEREESGARGVLKFSHFPRSGRSNDQHQIPGPVPVVHTGMYQYLHITVAVRWPTVPGY